MNEPEQLSGEHRAALAAWAEHSAPDDFADRVVANLGVAELDGDADDDLPGAPSSSTASVVIELQRARRLRRSVVAIACALAAAVLIGYWVRGLVIENREYEERLARLVAAQPDPSPELASLRVAAHTTFARHCTPCHDSADGSAKGDALEVFDVQDRRWWLSMSDRQLEVALTRMATEDGVGPQERRGIAAYVEAELAYRGGST